jgi:hypothetical protein
VKPLKFETMKTFKINESAEIQCLTYETRNSWGHVAKLIVNGTEVDRTKIRYYNRTWESFEYESVIYQLLEKTKIIPKEQIPKFIKALRTEAIQELNSNFGFISAIAKLGDLFCDDQKEKNDWKKRIILAGLGTELDVPDDWDDLNESEKEKRLDLVIAELNKGN